MRQVVLNILVLLLIYHSTTFLRLRRLVCLHFYWKHEKKRILYLYDTIRFNRKTILKRMIREVQEFYPYRRVRQKVNILLVSNKQMTIIEFSDPSFIIIQYFITIYRDYVMHILAVLSG